jgi:hypothetical protein
VLAAKGRNGRARKKRRKQERKKMKELRFSRGAFQPTSLLWNPAEAIVEMADIGPTGGFVAALP